MTLNCNLGISHLIGHGELEEIQSVGIPLCDYMPMGTKRRGSCIKIIQKGVIISQKVASLAKRLSIWPGNDRTFLIKTRCET
jgi:hypothetical protein